MCNYTQSLFDLMGWQGGTIHQVAEVLGIPADDLIYGKLSKDRIARSDSDFIKGQYAYDSCERSWVLERLVPMYKGNLDFWLGFMRAAYLKSI